MNTKQSLVERLRTVAKTLRVPGAAIRSAEIDDIATQLERQLAAQATHAAPRSFPNRRWVEDAIKAAENPQGMRLNDGKERVTLPGGTLRMMLRLIDSAAPQAQGSGKDAPRRCKACSAPRQGETCHKCGEPTFEPHPSWEEPALPPVERIRDLAREVGYAIGEHGTKERDLDLIAAPWTDEAVGNYALLEHIANGLGAKIIETERKPKGRYAATLQMNGWFKNIDLSVCPAATAPQEAPQQEPVAAAIHYPDCWDTVNYPTLADALAEVCGTFRCSECSTISAKVPE